MQQGTGKFNVEGHHPTFFPVQLPPLLPYRVVKHMVKQFMGYLRNELVLMDEQRKSHNFFELERRASRQSIGSNISYTSGESEASMDLVTFYQH
jgi:hypothetical protein